ncbi:MAG: phosphoribosyltransferase family protein [Nanoarchaeota archaeon]|nr:orotate phosphoribosyltransferase [Nanoarchaeota archaeon]MBU4299844.1 orotate phosphoribosyltransferase [Nanoarchaeota archaeon]MBU4451685.1 orotate phosphoribosyltransferase [Nanoarchaeota archaeon]MCG2723610.1 orotate phosphoribosyltransferase [archaeon]
MQNIYEVLYSAEAIVFEGKKNFPQGWTTPIYFDVRHILSSPRNFDILTDLLSERVREINPDKIAGAFTGGIPLATAVSLKTNIPMIFVRKELPEKMKSQIEGYLKPGETVLLIDDITRSGESKLGFINGLRQAGGEITDTIVVVEYGIGSREVLKKAGVALTSLATVKDILAHMKKSRKMNETDYNALISKFKATTKKS